MDKLNEKYNVTRDNLILFINRLCNKRAIITQLNKDDTDFSIIKKLNKILIELKLKKLSIGINILDDEIFNIISLNKNNLSQDSFLAGVSTFGPFLRRLSSTSLSFSPL